jgi:AraC-like DNA-binding protein
MISSEFYSNNKNKNKNILSYMTLIFSKIDEEKSAENKMKADKKNEALSMIRRKIYEKPYENRTIKDTSHELRMSESLFQHAYKEQFGISFVKDLINSRIEYAKMLLINTNINANDISVMCGYKNYVHFSRQFTKNVGLSPLNYRMQNKL